MDDLFVHQLQDIYYAEKRIVGALPDMIAKASSPELKSAFEAHLGQTKNHVKRVEHYEMTRYGTLIAWAKALGRADCAQVLQQNLAEEKAADEKLTTLAENEVNRAAA